MKNFVIDINANTTGKSDFVATLTAYIPDTFYDNKVEVLHPAIVICPGGGYKFKSKREAEPIAFSFIAKGIAAFVLNYSCTPATFPQSLVEGCMSLDYVRENASEFKIDPNKIGICGFSAGGHLAASVAVYYNSQIVREYMKKDCEIFKPNYLILGYPVITSGEYTHRGSINNLLGEKATDEKMLDIVCLENHVTSSVPKTFIWHTNEDKGVPVKNSLLFANALFENNVPIEMHIYQKGSHGLSLGNYLVCEDKQFGDDYQCSGWIKEAVRFIYDF